MAVLRVLSESASETGIPNAVLLRISPTSPPQRISDYWPDVDAKMARQREPINYINYGQVRDSRAASLEARHDSGRRCVADATSRAGLTSQAVCGYVPPCGAWLTAGCR